MGLHVEHADAPLFRRSPSVSPVSNTEFKVLFVCTGNVCRSPLAEQIAVARMGRPSSPRDRIEISSAGLHAVDGVPMDERAAAESRMYGAEPAGAVSKSLRPVDARQQDLVLVMTAEQQMELVRRFPSILARTFVLRQFARIIPNLAPADFSLNASRTPTLREVVANAAQVRPHYTLVPPSADDIVDPYRRSSKIHAEVAAQINAAVELVVTQLFRRL